MPENHSRANKRVERLTVTDEPHERYQDFDPWTGKELEYGMPVLSSTQSGTVLDKEVNYYEVECPECNITAKYTHDSEPVCPNCGMICSGDRRILSEQIVIDAKSAGRIDGSENEKST